MGGAGAVGRRRVRSRDQVGTGGRTSTAGDHTPPRRPRDEDKEEDSGPLKDPQTSWDGAPGGDYRT